MVTALRSVAWVGIGVRRCVTQGLIAHRVGVGDGDVTVGVGDAEAEANRGELSGGRVGWEGLLIEELARLTLICAVTAKIPLIASDAHAVEQREALTPVDAGA